MLNCMYFLKIIYLFTQFRCLGMSLTPNSSPPYFKLFALWKLEGLVREFPNHQVLMILLFQNLKPIYKITNVLSIFGKRRPRSEHNIKKASFRAIRPSTARPLSSSELMKKSSVSINKRLDYSQVVLVLLMMPGTFSTTWCNCWRMLIFRTKTFLQGEDIFWKSDIFL